MTIVVVVVVVVDGVATFTCTTHIVFISVIARSFA